ncbi:DNA-binding NarL/FixJ family response regulator [Catenulispora sp. MAP5-51]|uniref:helix-turn-helix transcriptional regulator n=1 Tax=Catenulispora sp. MAP5-51 TaxID=3156298 RepID=UPI00351420F1
MDVKVAGVQSQIVGRAEDVQRICEFFAENPGHGLHVIGDAGVGKTTLLDATAEAMTRAGTRVLRADGVEFEADIMFAGLHQLLTPLLDDVAELPPEHRDGLRIALGLDPGPAPDRLLVVNATLTLLRRSSAGAPLVLMVDDLPWLDKASAIVLGFVARRLSGSRVGFLAASRSGEPTLLDRSGLAEIHLEPLDEVSAHLLLAAYHPALAARVRARVVADAGGNPLALLELPAELSASQRSALEELPSVLPLGQRLRTLFAARIAVLSDLGRELLLLAALDGTGDLTVLFSASALSEAEMWDVLTAAEQQNLIRVDPSTRRVVYRHPLIRSAVVDAATIAERRSAYMALAEALADRPERRAQHLAEAAIQPDEEVAHLLHDAGRSALHRGDTVGAVATLIRSADLSPDSGDRGRRLAEAAYAGAEAKGDITGASDLLRRAQSADLDPTGTLYAAAAAVYVLLDAEAPLEIAYRLLVGAIEAAGPHYDADDEALIDALHTLQLVCWWGGREQWWPPFLEAVSKVTPAPPPVLALAAKTFPDPARTGTVTTADLDEVRWVLRQTQDPTLLIRGATASVYVDRVSELRDRLWEMIRAGRAGGRPPRRHLGALMHLCMEGFLVGEWEEAQNLIDEGMALCADGYPFFAWYFQFNQVLLHGARGRADEGNALAEQMVRWATRRGVGAAVAFAHQAATLVNLGGGDYEAAYRHATALSAPGTLSPYTAHALWGVFDLVEAAVRTGRMAEATAHVQAAKDLEIGRLSDRYEMLALGAAGLVAPDEEAVELLRRALRAPNADRWVFEAARIRLALGERLRRAAARGEAREPLTAALESFIALGAAPWAERARTELRATGQPTGRVVVQNPLTPQELEIAQMAASGLTNRQIGERLYLSHRTVGSHLYQAFPKLGITTRAALRDALATMQEG